MIMKKQFILMILTITVLSINVLACGEGYGKNLYYSTVQNDFDDKAVIVPSDTQSTSLNKPNVPLASDEIIRNVDSTMELKNNNQNFFASVVHWLSNVF